MKEAYGTGPGAPKWNDRADVDSDGYVGHQDAAIVHDNLGRVGDS